MTFDRILIFLVLIPYLLSLDKPISEDGYLYSYLSPEGIAFVSYTENWNEEKLKQLYKELLKNKHGKELNALQEVVVQKGGYKNEKNVAGYYKPMTTTITLLHGEKKEKVEDFRYVLSHEYGHHVAFYYNPSHLFSFGEWSETRGIKNERVTWIDEFERGEHKWIPEEIFADDYVLLYGATSDREWKTTEEMINEGTSHENPFIKSPLMNEELHEYLEKEIGLEVEKERKLKEVSLFDINLNQISYKTEKNEHLIYRLEVYLFEKDSDGIRYVNEMPTLYVYEQNAKRGSVQIYDLRDFVEKTELKQKKGMLMFRLCVGNIKTGSFTIVHTEIQKWDGSSLYRANLEKQDKKKMEDWSLYPKVK